MKRFFSLILFLSLLLCGCSSLAVRIKEPVTFYYVRTNYQYFETDGIIVSEEREASGHRDDLNYLLALYLMGPSGEDMTSPLPKNTRLFLADQAEDRIYLLISSLDSSLSDAEFSLACACLTLTCLDITDAQSVTITSGNRSVTMSRDTILQNESTTAAPEETQ